jgi:hypothetical protein
MNPNGYDVLALLAKFLDTCRQVHDIKLIPGIEGGHGAVGLQVTQDGAPLGHGVHDRTPRSDSLFRIAVIRDNVA